MLENINWGVRLRSKEFWIAMIPALLVLAQQVLKLFGVDITFDQLQDQLLAIVNSVFLIMSIVGIAVDVTTPGIADSELTMMKTEPESITLDEAQKLLAARHVDTDGVR